MNAFFFSLRNNNLHPDLVISPSYLLILFYALSYRLHFAPDFAITSSYCPTASPECVFLLVSLMQESTWHTVKIQ